MNPSKPNPQRRKALAAALKKLAPEDMLSLEELATLWGTAKTRFTNVKQDMIRTGYDFPPPVKGPKNSNLYLAKQAVEVMLDYETRNDRTAMEKDQVIKQILGHGNSEENQGVIPISELAILNREAARAEDRARKQGEVTPVAKAAAVAGEVFSIITDFFGDLDARVDPNGQLPRDVRSKIKELGAAAQIQLYEAIESELSDDPDTKNQDSKRPARRTGRSR